MLQLNLKSIKWETADTATFYLSDVSGRKINYKAGQFITLIFTHHAEEIRRSYSLSSSPNEELLSITVKRIANGEISRFMLTKLKQGDIIKAIEPAGRFVVSTLDDDQTIFFFAAGSGISPIFSQLKYLLSCPGKQKMKLFYSSQDASAVLFESELKELQSLNPDRLETTWFLSSQGKRLNNILVEQLVRQSISEASSALFYLCGPFTYMRMVRLTLLYMGIDPDQIRKENFVLETVGVSFSIKSFPPKNIRIKYRGELHDLIVGENQSILQAALQNSLYMPYSCRNGVCSACEAKCTTGKIEMAKNDVLTDADLADGWILTCTGHPLTDDVLIEFH